MTPSDDPDGDDATDDDATPPAVVAGVALAGTVVPHGGFGGSRNDDAHLVDGRLPASRVARAFRDVAGQERGAWTRELTLEPARFDGD